MTQPPTSRTTNRPDPRGACPGVAAPMVSGDGLLLRVRHPIGGLTLEQARAVADAAERFGNGQLELTSRGNLQLRGVGEADLTEAQEALIRAGVADADAEREAVRNVLAAPVSDLDPTAVADVTGTARSVADAVADDPRLRGLPPKTGIVVDGGGSAAVPEVYADVRLDAIDTTGYRIALAGRAADAVSLGRVAAEDAARAITVVLSVLVSGDNAAAPPRMAAALAERGEARFRDALAPVTGETTPSAPLAYPGGTCAPGLDVTGQWVHAVFPFGALSAGQLRGIAAIAESHAGDTDGIGSLRLTPWRSVLVTGVGERALDALRELGAITDAADSRRFLGACVGAPGCASATTATRSEALALEARAPTLLAAGERLHVSGCGKGCGAVRQAAVMLVAEGGEYAMTLAGGVQQAPDWSPASWETVCRRIASLDALFAQARDTVEESLEQLINRLGRTTVVRRVEEDVNRV